jgi:hypothetical protein
MARQLAMRWVHVVAEKPLATWQSGWHLVAELVLVRMLNQQAG